MYFSLLWHALSFHPRQTSHGKPHLGFAASKNLFHYVGHVVIAHNKVEVCLGLEGSILPGGTVCSSSMSDVAMKDCSLQIFCNEHN